MRKLNKVEETEDNDYSQQEFETEERDLDVGQFHLNTHSDSYVTCATKDEEEKTFTMPELVFNKSYDEKSKLLEEFENIDDLDMILKNHFELGWKFNSEYIFKIIEKAEEMSKEDDWELHLDEKQIKVWLAAKGSFINAKHPFVYSELRFDNNISFEDVINILATPEKAVKCKPYLNKVEFLDRFAKNGIILHSVYNEISKDLPSCDFVEKHIVMQSSDQEDLPIIILFSSSVPNLHAKVDSRIKRWDTIFSVTIIGCDTQNLTLVKSYTQWDYKISMLDGNIANKHVNIVKETYERILVSASQ